MDAFPESAERAVAFHAAFAQTYVKTARLKYPRMFGQFPFHSQDVHVIHGGHNWWHVACIPGQRDGDLRLGPIGRFTLQAADPDVYPDLAALVDLDTPCKEAFCLAMNADFPLYHEAFAPPGVPSQADVEAAATALAIRMVDEHAAGHVELEAITSKIASLHNARQFLNDLYEARACMRAGRYRAAVVTCCAAAEGALVGKLEDMGHPVRQEERTRVLGHEHHSYPAMVQEVYRRSAVSGKTRDGLDTLNGLRRGLDHSRPDATMQDDAEFAWTTLVQLLRELAK